MLEAAEVIRVFVGGTAEHVLPARVLEYSIRRRTSRPVEVSLLWDSAIPIPDVTKEGNRPRTSFSFQRFLIPEICGFKGKGIYLDSDMVVLGDIGDLWDHPFPAHHRVQVTPKQSAVMMVDNAVGWRIATLVAELNAGTRSYASLMGLSGFGTAPSLPGTWNSRDVLCARCRLIHYTNMRTQPWLRAGHRYGAIWEAELLSAIADGVIAPEEVWDAVQRGDVRPSLAGLVNRAPPGPDELYVFPNDRRDRSKIVQPRGVTQ